MIVEFNVDCVINSGSAGGIRNRLHVGDVVLSTGAAYHDADATAFGYKRDSFRASRKFLKPIRNLFQDLRKQLKNKSERQNRFNRHR